MEGAVGDGSMHVVSIWRHPVKSLQGQQLTEALIDGDGLRGDRCWGIRDETTGRILTGRREPRLLLAAASLDDDGEPTIVLPSGDVCRGIGAATDAALCEWLERPVSLVGAVGDPGGEAEFFADATDDSSEALAWTMPRDRFVDASPLLLLTTASLRAGATLHAGGDWNVRRFRPNIFIDAGAEGFVEDDWCGHDVRIGAVSLAPRQPCARCTMVTRPQPDLDRDVDIYRTLARHHGGTFGVWTDVRVPGTVAIDDPVTVG